MTTTNLIRTIAIALAVVGPSSCTSAKEFKLLNYSYDPPRDFYQDYNAAIAVFWTRKSGYTKIVQQSSDGHTRQAHATDVILDSQ